MPAYTITEHYRLHDRSWQWVLKHGHPAQYYGEPYPSNEWIMEQADQLWDYRQAKQYPQADATRQWLRDYGVIVEYDNETLRVKW